MGITVVSAASLNSPGKGAGSPLPVAAGADFAALLTQQLASPQFLGIQMEAMAGTEAGSALKDSAADDPTEDEAATAIDVGAFLAAAGLLPAPTSQGSAQGTDDALAGQGGGNARGDQIAGIAGQLSASSGKDLEPEALGGDAQEDAAASLAGDLLKGDTANLAADAKPASGGEHNFAATLAAQTQRAGSRTEGPATATVHTPINDSRWSQDFGEKIVWLAKNDQQTAQLNINPPQLGPMQITLSLNGDQASALFVSAHAEVRQAIQEAMPQLKEMLAGAGINLGQANVGAQLAQQQHGGEQSRPSGSSRLEDDNAILRAENGQGNGLPLSAIQGGRGMVDLFA